MKWGPDDWARLGTVIRNSREAQGYSRKRLAYISGVSEKSIQLTEEGRVPTRWPKSLEALGDALGWRAGLMVEILDGDASDVELADNSTAPAGGANFDTDALLVTSDGSTSVVEAKHARSPQVSMRSARDIELAQSGHLAQDVFMRQARRYRKLQGISLEELAEQVSQTGSGLELQDLKRLEEGTQLLRPPDALAVAKALGTTVPWLLGSGFSGDAPEEMSWPPDAEEMEAEAKAVQRRLADVGAEVMSAHQSYAVAMERLTRARQESDMAMAMLHSLMSQEREMERHYQYLLGRIDSLRVASGEEPIMRTVLVEEDVSDETDTQEEVGALIRKELGEKLERGRLAAGLTHEELHRRTRIRVHVIKALEKGDFSVMPTRGRNVYARGHIRTLARELNLDTPSLVQQYDDSVRADEG